MQHSQDKAKAKATSSYNQFYGGANGFLFIDCTAKYSTPLTKKQIGHKNVRAQAARASSAIRVKTIRERAAERRGGDVTPTWTSENDWLCDLFAESWSGDASTSPGTVNWECGLQSILQSALERATVSLGSLQNPCDIRPLARCFLNRSFYDSDLTLSCLSLLVATEFNVISAGSGPSRDHLSRPIIVQLRQQLLVAAQAAVQAHILNPNVNRELAGVLFLLGGWEWMYGDVESCECHLRALPSLMGNETGANDVHAIYILQGAPFFDIVSGTELPKGFEHYKARNLLPACLMDVMGNFNGETPQSGMARTNVRRVALLAMSCQPTDPADYGTSIQSKAVAHVKLAAVMLSVMMQLGCDEDAASTLEAWYAESLVPPSRAMLDTEYDEIMVWCLCIFCASSPHPSRLHTELLSGFVSTKEEWDLETILHRYVCPDILLTRLQYVLPALFN